jgi:hypothetical protein
MSPEKNPFEVLGVSPGADPAVILAAYRALARKYHPDVNRGVAHGDLEERMSEINRAIRELTASRERWRAIAGAGQTEAVTPPVLAPESYRRRPTAGARSKFALATIVGLCALVGTSVCLSKGGSVEEPALPSPQSVQPSQTPPPAGAMSPF